MVGATGVTGPDREGIAIQGHHKRTEVAQHDALLPFQRSEHLWLTSILLDQSLPGKAPKEHQFGLLGQN